MIKLSTLCFKKRTPMTSPIHNM